MGEVAYVDRPLYDYVQHGDAALGHAQANAGIATLGGLGKRLGDRLLARSLRRRSRRLLPRLRPPRGPGPGAAAPGSGGVAPQARRPQALRRGRSQSRRDRLAAPSRARGLGGRSETLGVERACSRESLVWRHVLRHHSREWQRPIGSTFDASLPDPAGGRATEAHADPETTHIERLLAPLGSDGLDAGARAGQPADPDDRPPAPVRRLHRQVQPGPQARRSRASGPDRDRRPDAAAARRLARAGRGLQRPRRARCRRSRSPSRASRDRSRSTRGDRFVATTWWTAYHAREAVAQDERDAVPLPDPGVRAVHLRDGLAGGDRRGDLLVPARRPVLDRVPEAPTSPPTGSGSTPRAPTRATGTRSRSRTRSRPSAARRPPSWPTATSRRLLFYARSEPHAKRNMFELGMIAISRAIEAGTFEDEWEFFGDRLGLGSGPGRAAARQPARDPAPARTRPSTARCSAATTSGCR